MARISNLYLFTYNSLQAIGWAVALFRILSSLVENSSIISAYASAGNIICFLQKLAFLEVVHGAIGIVPSGVVFPLMQWGGRTHFLLAIVRKIDEVQELPSVFITFLMWSMSEIIRYPQLALNCLGQCPFWITYLRYTAFIILYPIGVGPGEMWLMYEALPFIKKGLHANLLLASPSVIMTLSGRQVVLLFYPFLWLRLYLHLFKQRRSKLRRYNDKKTR